MARRLLHREHLGQTIADHEMVPVTLDCGIRDEVVHVRVVRQRCCVRSSSVVVDEAAEEAERLGLAQATQAALADLDLERLGLLIQGRNGLVELCFQYVDGRVRGQPAAYRGPGTVPQPTKRGGAPRHMRGLVQDHKVETNV